MNNDRDIFNLSKILIEELSSKEDFLNHDVICIENQPALKKSCNENSSNDFIFIFYD